MNAQPQNHKFDCSSEALMNNYGNGRLEFNADIAGIGVIISFVGTAGSAVVLLIFNYLFAYDPAKDPFASHTGSNPASISPRQWQPNTIDVQFLAVFRRIFGIHGKWKRTSAMIDEIILEMCDMQVITGLGILVSGFISLKNENSPLSASDWDMVVYLAWFSAATHMSGLVSLRSYLGSRRVHNIFRVVSMFLFLAVLIVAMVPTGYFNWPSPVRLRYAEFTAALPQSPAFCYFDLSYARELWESGCYMTCGAKMCSSDPNKTKMGPADTVAGSTAMQGMIMGIVILAYGFTIRLLKLFPQLAKPITVYLRRPVSHAAQAVLRALSNQERCIYDRHGLVNRALYHFWAEFVVIPGYGLYIAYRSAIHMLNSLFAEIVWLILVIAWGLVKLIDARNVKLALDCEVGNPAYNPWSFGQVIAVAPLMAPLIAVIRKLLSGAHNAPSMNEATTERGSYAINHEAIESGPPPSNLVIQQESAMTPNDPLTTGDRSQTSYLELPDLLTMLEETSSVRSSWFRACIFTTCLPWMAASARAAVSAIIGAKVVGEVSSSIWSGSFVSVWFSNIGLAWFLLVVHPISLALLVGVGLRLCRSGKSPSRGALGWYTLLCAMVNMGLTITILLSAGLVHFSTAVASTCGIYGFIIAGMWLRKLPLFSVKSGSASLSEQ